MAPERWHSGEREHGEVKSFYDILGVSQDATEEEIKKAYRKRAMETHPDKPENKGKEEEFKKVNEANEVLSDPIRRASYDSFIKSGGLDFEDDAPETEGWPSEGPKSDSGSSSSSKTSGQKPEEKTKTYWERYEENYKKRKEQGEKWKNIFRGTPGKDKKE